MYTILTMPGETMDKAVRRAVRRGSLPEGSYASGDPAYNDDERFDPDPEKEVVGIVKPHRRAGFYVYRQ